MKIEHIKILRGPNYFSNYRKNLVVMRLDLEELENFPTNKLEGFAERLEQLIPSLYNHRCSDDSKGGFLMRVREGTWMGHVIEHIALEMQTLAGMPVGYGRTRTVGKHGVYNVVFAYENERAGKYAALAAVKLVEAVMANVPYPLEEDIKELTRLRDRAAFGPSTKAIVEEAKRRNIPFKRLNRQSFIMFGQGKNLKLLKATVAGTTSSIGVETACDKDDTKRLLANAYLPIPEGIVAKAESEVMEAIQEIGFPLVMKPIKGNHGRDITTNIQSLESALDAFRMAKRSSDYVIIERFIEGDDYRFLVINYKLVAVARRTPAVVVGDGQRTITELVEEVNKDPRRGEGHEKVLTSIVLDSLTEKQLLSKGMNFTSIPRQGEIIYLKDTANISTGGTSSDVTDEVHPSNKFIAERVARLMNMDICGIDIIAKSVRFPITKDNGAILEVNAAPGFRMHLEPSEGKPRNVAKPVMDMLYPEGKSSRIPLIAVTGTNGKTTTVRLISHLATECGFYTGFTTTDGIYINNHVVHFGDCSGPSSAEIVLSDPAVDFAVLECARGGILRSGLAFDNCDVSVITNISEDHLGLGGINTLRELAKVKEVVAQSTFSQGYSVLNADDDLVFGMRRNLDCNIALFSTNGLNERVLNHCRNGGLAAYIDKGMLIIHRNHKKTALLKIASIPLSLNGQSEAMIKNILAAVLVAVIRKFDPVGIFKGLMSFIPSPALTPGRMNIFDFGKFKVMVDYVHNAGGFKELELFLGRVNATYKVGIFGATGDRRDEDIRDMGRYASRLFDEVIIRHDKDGRGRSNEELTRLLKEGISEVDPLKKITVITNEIDALQHAINHAGMGHFIVANLDKVRDCLAFLEQVKLDHENKTRLQTI